MNLGCGYPSHFSNPEVINVDHDYRVLSGGPRAAAADAAALPFPSAVFDGVLMKDILEHVPDPFAALDEVARVTKPGGKLIVTVPRAIPRAVWADPTHLRGFTAKALCSCLEVTGWAIADGPRRVGSVPGAGRIPTLIPHLRTICAIPGIGHRLGTNWMVEAYRVSPRPGGNH